MRHVESHSASTGDLKVRYVWWLGVLLAYLLGVALSGSRYSNVPTLDQVLPEHVDGDGEVVFEQWR